MRVLVTGTSGRIGSAIAFRLRQEMDVIGLDLIPGIATTVTGSILDKYLINKLCSGINGIIHVAGLHAPHIGLFSNEDFISVNVRGTDILLQAALQEKIPKFVYTSTTSLYGHSLVPRKEAVWVTEDLAPLPRDIYDETKLEAERSCEAASERGMTCISIRMSRCFPEPEREMALYRLYRGVDERDVAEGHYLALMSSLKGYEVFNISGAPPFSRTEAVDLLNEAGSVIKKHFPWAGKEFEKRQWSLPSSIDRVYVIDKARELLGYKPRYNFASLLGRTQ